MSNSTWIFFFFKITGKNFFTRETEFQDFRMRQVKGSFGTAMYIFHVSQASFVLILAHHLSLT